MSAELSRLQARIGAQERMSTILHARIEELSQDMTASFQQQVDYQIQFEKKVDERFNKVDERFDKIEATMAKKDDLVVMQKKIDSMEIRILDAFKQLLTVIETRLPAPQE